MGKITRWVEAVAANNHPYATMAGVDIKKSTDQLFEAKNENTEKKEEKTDAPE
ncbi:MAG: hypothetical protein LIP11_08155 [Clostridiales bacterium]|nr:hypothetical protein [Clostridiales bacterium]